MVELAARGLVAAGVRPGEMIGIYLPNCWEFGVAYHAATLAGAIPTTLNPTYREREVHYQLETGDAVALISDGALLTGIDLSATARVAQRLHHSQPRTKRLGVVGLALRAQPQRTTAGTGTRFSRGLGHASLLQRDDRPAQGRDVVAFQPGRQRLSDASPGEFGAISDLDVLLCFLPLYHIYGLTVGLNLTLMRGCTLVLMPRFDCERSLEIIVAGWRDDHAVRAANPAGLLPGGGAGKVSART